MDKNVTSVLSLPNEGQNCLILITAVTKMPYNLHTILYTNNTIHIYAGIILNANMKKKNLYYYFLGV